TLQDLRCRRHIKAKRGQNGNTKKRHGKNSPDVVLDVPVGTLVIDTETEQVIGDLLEDGDELVIAKGGDGGRGNARFATATDQAPRYHEPGWPGETRVVRLELKLLADVGLLGYPSVGKSTLITRISNARPRIEAWPFTTLTPKLGVVTWKNFQEF